MLRIFWPSARLADPCVMNFGLLSDAGGVDQPVASRGHPRVKLPGRMIAHCHIHIREIAKQAAGHLYDRLMVNDRCYQVWRRQNPDGGPQETQAAVC